MAMHGQSRVRLAVPLAVAGLLVWAMVGCFHLPVGERVQLTGTRRDFRKLDPAMIVPGQITRSTVHVLLGPPVVTSANGRVEAYALTTHQGLWVIPLCFSIIPDERHQYVLGLRYDAAGVLEHDRVVDVPMASSVGLIVESLEGAADEALRQALEDVDADNGVVLATSFEHEQHPEVPDVRPEFAVGGRPYVRLFPTTRAD